MSKINELREKRAKAIHDMREIVDRSESAGEKELTGDNLAAYERAFDEQAKLADAVKREEGLMDLERQMAADAIEGGNARQISKTESKSDLEMRAFRTLIVGGKDSMTPELMNALQFDSDQAGGYLSPPEQFVNDLIIAKNNMVFIRDKATVFPLNAAHSLGAPSLDTDPADAAWTAEIGSVSEDSSMDFGKRELSPTQLTKLVKVSMKLLRNSAMPAEQIVRERLAYKFGITEEKAYLTGTGASQPLGLFTASSMGISTSRDVSTGNATTSIKFDGLLEAKYSCKVQYQRNGEWIFHRDAVKQIAKLKDGDGQYIWQPAKTMSESDMLLGRPVNISEYAPNTFTTGQYVGMFGDYSNYWIAESLAMQVQRLNELYAATNQVGFIGRMELDGAPVLEEAFARVKLA
jgi:HK97 family phage major capsid protein